MGRIKSWVDGPHALQEIGDTAMKGDLKIIGFEGRRDALMTRVALSFNRDITMTLHGNLKRALLPNERDLDCDGSAVPSRGREVYSTGQGNLNPLSNSGGLQDTFS